MKTTYTNSMKKREDMNENYKLGDNIRHFRKVRNLTQDELSELLDVTSAYVSQLECGIHLPSMSIFIDLCKALEVEASILLGEVVPTELDEQDHRRWKLYKLMETLDDEEVDAVTSLVKTMKKKQRVK